MHESSSSSDRIWRRCLAGVVAEYLFVLLPVMVTAVMHLERKEYVHLISTPEWSFGTIVLLGQASVKLVAGVAGHGKQIRREYLVLTITLMFVFLIVPATTLLHHILTTDSPGVIATLSQMVLFMVATALFLVFGTVGSFSERAAVGAASE